MTDPFGAGGNPARTSQRTARVMSHAAWVRGKQFLRSGPLFLCGLYAVVRSLRSVVKQLQTQMQSLVFKASFAGVLATASFFSLAQSAQAPDMAAAPTAPPAALTANISLTTNYKFRGQDQDVLGSSGRYKTSSVKPAIQGGFDYTFGDTGFYVGNWNSSVDWLVGNNIEMDVYGGYKFKAGVFDLDVGVLQYAYPGNHIGNTTEIYGAATYTDEKFGAFTVKYSSTVSKDYFGFAGYENGSGLKGTNTGYLNVSYAREVIPHLTLKAAVGYTALSSDIRRGTGYKSYYDYNVGGAWDFGGGLTLSGSVQGGSRQSAYLAAVNPGVEVNGLVYGGSTQSINKPRLIATLTKTF